MKRFSALLCAVAVILSLSVSVVAENEAGGSFGSGFEWSFDQTDGTLDIIGSGIMNNFSDGTQPWKEYASLIKTVNLSEGIYTVSNYAFAKCTALCSVNLPKSLKSIGNYSFWGCKALEEIYLTENITSIGKNAFRDTALTSVAIPAITTSVGTYAFYNCKNLSSAVLPIGLTEIQNYTFYGCDALENIYFRGSIAEWNAIIIGENNTPLSSAKVSVNYVRYLDTGACPNGMKWAYDEDGTLCLEGEGDTGDFEQGNAPWSKLVVKAVLIGKDITKIGAYAFAGDAVLLHYRGTEAEWNELEIDLTNTALPNIPTTYEYGRRIASGICGEKTVSWQFNDNGILTISGSGVMNNYSDGSQPWYIYKDSIVSVRIEDGVKTVSNYAFSHCSNLASVSISKSVTSLGHYAFWQCKSLQNITIPDSVTSIGKNTFRESGLVSVNVPVYVISIGHDIFYNCKNLVSVIIPAGVSSIEDNAFGGCESLDMIYYRGSEVQWNSLNVGTNNDYIYEASIVFNYYCTVASGECGKTLKWQLNEIGTLTVSGRGNMYGFEEGKTPWEQSEVKSVIIEKNVGSIGKNAFGLCGTIDVYYRGSESEWNEIEVSRIGNEPFINAVPTYNYNKVIANGESGTSLNWIFYEDGTLDIHGKGAMNNYSDGNMPWNMYRTSIKTVNIEKGITSIGNSAFARCNHLVSVNLPDGITSIGNYSFWHCVKLTEIDLPESVARIGSNAFRDTGIYSIYLYKTVEEIGHDAFTDCNNFRTVYYEDNEDRLNKIAESPNSKLIKATGMFNYVKIIASGNCDGNISWKLDEKGKLTVGGNSQMQDFELSPWDGYAESITSVVIGKGISNIGINAFANCENLNTVYYEGNEIQWETVEIGSGNSYLENAELVLNYKPYMCGDVNNGGSINGSDLTLLAQYIAHWTVTVGDGADSDGNGVINGSDLTLLAQYIARWDVKLGN